MDEYYLKLCVDELIEAQKSINKARTNLVRAGADYSILHWFEIKIVHSIEFTIQQILINMQDKS